MRIVVALGGNALLQRGERPDADTQSRHVAEAAGAIGGLAALHELVLTHGNGPQVGLLALQGEAYAGVEPYPLDVLDAQSEGMIGHMLELALRNALPGRELVTVLTEVEVDEEDPAFERPSKPVGSVYPEAAAKTLAAEHGWHVAADGDGWRRVVPSPQPREILPVGSIRSLVERGCLVICAGGGGIPVVSRKGTWQGAEAVIDKDLTAALLAERLEAEVLVMLTDVEAVESDWGTPAARRLQRITPSGLREHDFAAGSMGPKVEAACRFVEATGGRAAIGALRSAVAVVAGEAGTQVIAGR